MGTWDLGLVRGTARGIAREADRKHGDHIRQMNTETSQLDALIGQLRSNKEDRYRRDRDAENTRRWNLTDARAKEAHTWAGDRHAATLDTHAYQKGQRPILKERAEDIHTWRGEQQERHRDENEFMYGDEDTPGYRDLQRDATQLQLEATRRNEAWLTSAEGKDYTDRLRGLGEDKLETDIDVNKARAWALRNPKSASTARPKTLTYTDVRRIGENLPSPRTMLKDHGTEWNPLNWGHKYLPWTAPMGQKSLTSQLQSSGVEAGLRLRRQTPGGIAMSELEQQIGALWEGVLSQEIDGRILPDALFNDVPENLQGNRMNDAYRVFRAGVREGLGLPIEDTGTGGNDLFEEFLEQEAPGGETIGEIDTSFWNPNNWGRVLFGEEGAENLNTLNEAYREMNRRHREGR